MRLIKLILAWLNGYTRCPHCNKLSFSPYEKYVQRPCDGLHDIWYLCRKCHDNVEGEDLQKNLYKIVSP